MDPIRFDGVQRLTFPNATAPAAPAADPSAPSFGDMFKKVLTDTSDLETGSRDLIQSFLRGEPVELHQVMAASEEASISLELLVELRNKLTDAYRSVMNVQ
ncbi:MAG: flagellar hook-basal body complex protein FliE [Gemmatimonadetes bacterium]|nr:flagellar hook-basal body complex protein FliE [Gemmatimonadota bacterium]